jgi:hypothetical protein
LPSPSPFPTRDIFSFAAMAENNDAQVSHFSGVTPLSALVEALA